MRLRPNSLRSSWPCLLFLLCSAAGAGEWSRAYVRSLPDSAFAVVERSPDGKTARHLPHHDRAGALDVPHLKSALGRLKQVKWTDPSNEAEARGHLERHWQEYRQESPNARGER